MKKSVLPHGGKEVSMSIGSLPVIVPSRYYAHAAYGGRFSMTSAVDFLADSGFDGIDLSLDTVSGLGDGRPSFDDDWRGVLYSFGNRAAARGLTLPVCHLPFYMPNPDDGDAMARFSKTQLMGLDAAAMLKIPCAVIHPIVRHSSQRKRRSWLDENLLYLAPIRERAARLGVTLAVKCRDQRTVICPVPLVDLAVGRDLLTHLAQHSVKHIPRRRGRPDTSPRASRRRSTHQNGNCQPQKPQPTKASSSNTMHHITSFPSILCRAEGKPSPRLPNKKPYLANRLIFARSRCSASPFGFGFVLPMSSRA